MARDDKQGAQSEADCMGRMDRGSQAKHERDTAVISEPTVNDTLGSAARQ